jgi:hypothetical protein
MTECIYYIEPTQIVQIRLGDHPPVGEVQVGDCQVLKDQGVVYARCQNPDLTQASCPLSPLCTKNTAQTPPTIEA